MQLSSSVAKTTPTLKARRVEYAVFYYLTRLAIEAFHVDPLPVIRPIPLPLVCTCVFLLAPLSFPPRWTLVLFTYSTFWALDNPCLADIEPTSAVFGDFWPVVKRSHHYPSHKHHYYETLPIHT